MKTCSQPDCLRTDHFGRGLCGKHYQRFRYRGSLDAISPVLASSCAICGVSLPGDRDPRRIYCSRACNERARVRRYQAGLRRRFDACVQCGGPMGARRSDARFCSDKCGNDSHNAETAAHLRANRKPCTHCEAPLPLGRQRFCSDACNMAHRRPEKYGLSRDELAALLAQHNACAICGTDYWGKKGPQIDHDHATDAIRGVLCSNCNQGLGRFADDPARLRIAADYLTK